ncbi:hypothetical protein MARPU_13790 [Marichromatium purpuratum 984]|uniref:DUF2760 domain-containing protein n=1 Tax=Marichromatium purpuratum 984 TaxID=765910 RepID=W0E6X5_MARPU|nr:DUF2760 domain-containing protein [Marichromatium purpuratum]AHF04801.1 hypothetical protein MARPU_13790 [Marichromatium purpuratum 984]
MAAPEPPLSRRIRLALKQAWRILVGPRPDAALELQQAHDQNARRGGQDAALQLLALLQREGRLVDFLQQDIADSDDATLGASARIVHNGCRRVLDEHLPLAPICQAPEGTRITLEPGFDANRLRPSGALVGEPPFTGTLIHPGWEVRAVRLPAPTPGHDPRIIAAAEVEL